MHLSKREGVRPGVIIIIIIIKTLFCFTGDLRLSGGPSLYEGRVEMYISDVIGWATVCEENVDFGWAVRACQKLEYRPATSFGTMRNTTGGGPIVLCDGGLAAEYCQVVNQTDPTVSCNHMRDVHVVCDGYDTG